MEGKSALNAWLDAQKIALAPIIFQAARLLRDSGILSTLRESRAGLTIEEIADKVETSCYGVLVLLEAGLAAEIVQHKDGRYLLAPTGLPADGRVDPYQHGCRAGMLLSARILSRGLDS